MKIMYVADERILINDSLNLILRFLWKTFLKKFTRSLTKKSEGCDEDKDAHDDCGDRVEDNPFIT